MKASEERISELCSSLGRMVDGRYQEMDDCQINFDELALSIWKEDESLKNLSLLVYNLNAFEEHFIHLIFSENPEIAFISLKALAACTYPYSSNVQNPQKMLEIYQHYKYVLVTHKPVLFQALTYLLNIVENPRSQTADFQRAEVCFTFIRNIVIIQSSPDINEAMFDILEDGGLFDIIAALQMKAFASRIPKFAPIIAGILYGLFTPFLPLQRREIEDQNQEYNSNPNQDETNENDEQINHGDEENATEQTFVKEQPKKKTNPILDSIMSDLKQQRSTGSSRHGHWGATLSIRNSKTKEGFTYTGPITPQLLQSAPMPKPIIKSRARPRKFEPRPQGLYFSRKAEQAASKLLWTQSFNCVFTRVLPRSFSAYDKTTTATQQLQMCDLTRFFIEFILKYGGETRAFPLATEHMIKYFLSMANWYIEQRIPDLEGIPMVVALHKICLLFSSYSEYYTNIIKYSKESEDIGLAKDAVSEHAKDIENYMVTLLCNKLKTKATMNMIQDTIVALEKLYKLYAVAEDENLSRRKTAPEDITTEPELEVLNDIFATYEDFNAEMIIERLVKRSNVLIPFFQCIKIYDKLNTEELNAITTMLTRFIKYRMGLAHIFKLPYFIIIDHLLNEDKKFMKSEDQPIVQLREILEQIVEKFFYNINRDPNLYISLLVGPEDDELYDERRAQFYARQELYSKMGLSQKESAALEGRPYKDYSYSSSSDSEDETYKRIKELTKKPERAPGEKKKKKIIPFAPPKDTETPPSSPSRHKLQQTSQTKADESDELEFEDDSDVPSQNSHPPVSIPDEFSDDSDTTTTTSSTKPQQSTPNKLKQVSDSSDSDDSDDDKVSAAELLKQMKEKRAAALSQKD